MVFRKVNMTQVLQGTDHGHEEKIQKYGSSVWWYADSDFGNLCGCPYQDGRVQQGKTQQAMLPTILTL